jgi:hypothetical protein
VSAGPTSLSVMVAWERERILAQSPDAASTAAARQLASASRWSSLGCTDRCLWGVCRGSSGSRHYQAVVDVGPTPAYACSCPSRKIPCKHAMGLLLLWSSGGVPPQPSEADFAADWLQQRASGRSPETGSAKRPDTVVDPEAAARRAAARFKRVSSGLEDLDGWLRDQLHSGLAGVERAGYAHFDRIAARMVDAQAPGVASMLRGIPAELATDGWPERVLERLAALHLLIQAHRRLGELPSELAANVRSRVGYPVTKAAVLGTAGVHDQWIALGAVDTIEYQLETRRVWLYGTRTRRWGLWLSFAAPGISLDTSILPGHLVQADLHFYPGSSFRALPGQQYDPPESIGPLPAGTLEQVRRRFAALLAADPWATRLPALISAVPIRPEGRPQRWRVRDREGSCVDLVGLTGDPWLLLARSGGEPIDMFGEWTASGFRPLSVLPDRFGESFCTALVS